MEISDLMREMYGRIAPLCREAVQDLDAEALNHRPTPQSNSIGWLIWHVARVVDHQIGEQSGDHQLWVEGTWAGRLGMGEQADDIGFGHSPERVAAFRIDDAAVLLDYLDAVQTRTQAYLGSLTGADLDRVVDRSWDPHVSLGVRLVSVADDALQHAGQAAYVRGMLGHPGKY